MEVEKNSAHSIFLLIVSRNYDKPNLEKFQEYQSKHYNHKPTESLTLFSNQAIQVYTMKNLLTDECIRNPGGSFQN